MDLEGQVEDVPGTEGGKKGMDEAWEGRDA